MRKEDEEKDEQERQLPAPVRASKRETRGKTTHLLLELVQGDDDELVLALVHEGVEGEEGANEGKRDGADAARRATRRQCALGPSGVTRNRRTGHSHDRGPTGRAATAGSRPSAWSHRGRLAPRRRSAQAR